MHRDRLRAGPCLCEETGSPLPPRVLPSLVFSSLLPDVLIVAGCLCVWGSCMRGRGRHNTRKKSAKPQTTRSGGQRHRVTLRAASKLPACRTLGCPSGPAKPGRGAERPVRDGRALPWSGTAVPRQQAGVAAAALHRAPPAAGAAAGVCSAGSAPLSAPGAGAGKGARGKGAGAVSGPSLSYRQRRLRSGQKVAGGMVRGGGLYPCGVDAGLPASG